MRKNGAPLWLGLLGTLALLAPLEATAQSSIDWSSCPLSDDDDPGDAECATVELPRFHDRSDGESIEIALKRSLQGSDPEGTIRQLWFLNGRPGDSGVEALGRLVSILAGLPIDIYTLDHRGVGGSEVLECPE